MFCKFAHVKSGDLTQYPHILLLSRPPKAILLHLKRFIPTENENGDFVLEKNRVKLPLTETLSVSSSHFSLGNNNDDEEELHYQLRGVVNHHGKKADNGHYSACCKRTVENQERWVFFDDSVGKIRSRTYNTSTYGTCPDEVNNHRDSYLALYELTDDDDQPEIVAAVVSNEVESVANMEVEEDQMDAEKEDDDNDVEDIVQAPAISAAAPPSEENQAPVVSAAWNCHACTYENADNSSKICLMCGTERRAPSKSTKVMVDEENVQMEVEEENESNEVEIESDDVEDNVEPKVLGEEQQVQQRQVGVPCSCQGQEHLCWYRCPCYQQGLRCTSDCTCHRDCKNKCIQRNSLFDFFSKKD